LISFPPPWKADQKAAGHPIINEPYSATQPIRPKSGATAVLP